MGEQTRTDGGVQTEPTREDKYRTPFPSTTRGWVILGYFAGLSILYYVLIATVGTMPTRVLGFPVLVWLTVSIYVTFAGGMYLLVLRPELRDRRGDER